MNAVIAMTGQGGWPLSVFLTPTLEPFYGGTYFPPVPRYDLPSFLQVLQAVHLSWEQDRASLQALAKKVYEHLRQTHTWQPSPQPTDFENVLSAALNELERTYDWQHGGWGRAPKFLSRWQLNSFSLRLPAEVIGPCPSPIMRSMQWQTEEFSTSSEGVFIVTAPMLIGASLILKKCFTITPNWPRFTFRVISYER